MVSIRRHLAPLTRTSGRGNTKKYITIHETANRGRGAGAASHARLQANTNSRQASWHYQVDDKEIVQSFDDDVKCWHAGGTANSGSIAIEICVNSDSNYNKALDNAAALVAHLRKKHGIPWNRVVSHKFWTGKNCPTIMLSRKGQWDKFIKATDPKGSNKVTTTTTKPAASKPKPSSSKTVSQMASEVIAGHHGSGHANRRKSLGISAAQYEQVRAEVNRRAGVSTSKSSSSRPSKSVSQMATEVVNGRHGTGHANRRRSLGVSQSVYNQVRAEVNRRAGGGGSSSGGGKSISQMATEILQGKHGNGHANRQRSLGINNATYAKVRKEVNRRS